MYRGSKILHLCLQAFCLTASQDVEKPDKIRTNTMLLAKSLFHVFSCKCIISANESLLISVCCREWLCLFHCFIVWLFKLYSLLYNLLLFSWEDWVWGERNVKSACYKTCRTLSVWKWFSVDIHQAAVSQVRGEAISEVHSRGHCFAFLFLFFFNWRLTVISKLDSRTGGEHE